MFSVKGRTVNGSVGQTVSVTTTQLRPCGVRAAAGYVSVKLHPQNRGQAGFGPRTTPGQPLIYILSVMDRYYF